MSPAEVERIRTIVETSCAEQGISVIVPAGACAEVATILGATGRKESPSLGALPAVVPPHLEPSGLDDHAVPERVPSLTPGLGLGPQVVPVTGNAIRSKRSGPAAGGDLHGEVA
jgi:hypothetical protein